MTTTDDARLLEIEAEWRFRGDGAAGDVRYLIARHLR